MFGEISIPGREGSADVRRERFAARTLATRVVEYAVLVGGDCLVMVLGFIFGQWLAWSEAPTGAISDWEFGSWLDRNGYVDAGLFALVVGVGLNRFWARGHYSRRQP